VIGTDRPRVRQYTPYVSYLIVTLLLGGGLLGEFGSLFELQLFQPRIWRALHVKMVISEALDAKGAVRAHEFNVGGRHDFPGRRFPS